MQDALRVADHVLVRLDDDYIDETGRVKYAERYRQLLWMRWRENAQTATFSSMLLSLVA